MKMQSRKVTKSLMGPLNVGDPGEMAPVPPPLSVGLIDALSSQSALLYLCSIDSGLSCRVYDLDFHLLSVLHSVM